MTTSIATAADIPQLCDLLEELFSQEAEFSPDRAKQMNGLRLIIENPATGTILVLRDEGKIIGMVNLLYTVSTFLGAKVAILEDMILHGPHRGKGGGSRLLSAALEYAAAQGCRRITLLTDETNEQAIAFYRRHGFGRSPMIPLRRMMETKTV